MLRRWSLAQRTQARPSKSLAVFALRGEIPSTNTSDMKFSEYLYSKHRCGRPDFRLLEENDRFRTILCLSCNEVWNITRSKLKAQAREEVRLDRIRAITEAERLALRTTFGRYYAGRRTEDSAA